MSMLSPRLQLKVAQKQILTPGLVQMVTVLQLNRMELKDMINQEIVENPVLEESPEVTRNTDAFADAAEAPADGSDAAAEASTTDPFDEIDFGSFFDDYLDP